MLDIKKTLAKILRQGEFKTLLWTNTTSSDTFPAQTISLDLSDYDFVEVEFFDAAVADAFVPSELRIPVGQTRGVVLFHSLIGNGPNENTGVRMFTVSASGVAIGNYAYKNRRSGGTATTANYFCLPKQIYGVKLVGGGTA